jgi:hypothetical protein
MQALLQRARTKEKISLALVSTQKHVRGAGAD